MHDVSVGGKSKQFKYMHLEVEKATALRLHRGSY